MRIEFNHTIIHCRNKRESADFVTGVLGLPPALPFLHFLVVKTTNNASLDFLETNDAFLPQHYAFLVGEREFDDILERIQRNGIPHWADPGKKAAGTINTFFGGRGFYFEEPSGNFLEVITRPYDYSIETP